MAHLDLFFPDWQPAGADPAPLHGAYSLRRVVETQFRFEEVPVEPSGILDVESSILGYTPILKQLRACVHIVDGRQPTSMFSIGGTCGMEVIPVSYLNRVTNADLTVIWFDAHADLNTPQSSPSRHFHGTPVRALLGEGNREIGRLLYSTLMPTQVILAGVRDLDPEESMFVRDNKVTLLSAAALENPKSLIDAIESKGHQRLYIHLDFDVLDPTSFPHMYMPVADGMEPDGLIAAVAAISDHYTVVGSSMVELSARDRSFEPTVEMLLPILRPKQEP